MVMSHKRRTTDVRNKCRSVYHQGGQKEGREMSERRESTIQRQRERKKEERVEIYTIKRVKFTCNSFTPAQKYESNRNKKLTMNNLERIETHDFSGKVFQT